MAGPARASVAALATVAATAHPRYVSRMKLSHLVAVSLPAFSFLGACATQRGPSQTPTPQRPRISHNASTTAVDTFELEAGIEVDPSDFIDAPVLVKYGISPRTEFVFGGSPIRHNDRLNNTGLGDVVLGARHRVVDETSDDPAIAVATLIKLPTADATDGLGTGETDVFFSLAMDKKIEDVRAVGFYRLGLLGSPFGPGNDIRHDLAAAGTVALAQNLDVYGELAGVFIPEYDFEALFATLGGNFVLGPGTVFDAGFRFGISDEAPDFTLVAGVTHNFGASGLASLSGK